MRFKRWNEAFLRPGPERDEAERRSIDEPERPAERRAGPRLTAIAAAPYDGRRASETTAVFSRALPT